jgi:hypothetical protein
MFSPKSMTKLEALTVTINVYNYSLRVMYVNFHIVLKLPTCPVFFVGYLIQ